MIPKNAIKKFTKPSHRDIAISILISYGIFPQTQEGIQKAKNLVDSKDEWLAPSNLPNYYDGIESDLMTGKETAGIIFIRNTLKQFYGLSSAGTETAKDTRQKQSEEESNIDQVDPPKLPPSHYIQGQTARWEPEFESDIDHAVYYAGKSIAGTGKTKSVKQQEVYNWLLSIGLTSQQIIEHRKKVLEKIKETINLPGVEEEYPYVYIDSVEQNFVLNQIQEEEIEDDEEYDDLYGNSLDDLINFVKIEEEPNPNEKEVEVQAEVATEVLTEVENAEQQQIDESILNDLPEELKGSLTKFINKRIGKPVIDPKKEKTSSGNITNTKIFRFLTNNLYKIQGQLDGINATLQTQTVLLQTNLEITSNIYSTLNEQNQVLTQKLDKVLGEFTRQNNLSKKYIEDEEDRLAEQNLENQRDVASTEGSVSTLGRKRGSGNSLLRRIVKYFGRKLGIKLWKLLPLGLRSRARLLRKIGSKFLPSRLKQRAASALAKRLLPKVATKTVQNIAPRAAIKGFEHIALPGVTRAMKTADAPAAKAIINSENILTRALKSPAIQRGLIKVLGKEGAEKLSIKLAAKLVPGVATAYGLGEGIARIAMGDVKGGFLSFGSAIPAAGWAFAAIDILRDINIDAYTKHIEANLPAPSDENFAAFFAEALGVTPEQYETGGVASQTVMLHGTELIKTPKELNTQPVDPIGGILLAASGQYINQLGPIGSPIAPMFKQVAAPLVKTYDVPSTIIQTNVGGSLPSLKTTMDKINKKKKLTPEEELSGVEKDLLETKDSDSFADKLLKMLDPEGKFQNILKNINQPPPPIITDDSLFAEGGYAVQSSEIGDKFGDRGGKHMGIDISSSRFTMGTPISIIKSGTVVDVGRLDAGTGDPDGWGNFVVVKHDDGLYSLYGHLSEINVNKGQRLEPSSAGIFPIIGKIGSTGRSTGAHLHLEVGTGWSGGVLTGHINPLPLVNQLFRGGGNVKKIDRPTGTSVKVNGLGQQGVMGNQNFGPTSGVGSKGYLIIPGHAAGGGAPEEKKLVKMLAKNAYDNIKSKYPTSNVYYADPDSMFGDDDAGWEKQKKWYKQKESEGWEILEVHMDASMESGQGKGRGVITSKSELNPVESYFAQNYGAFDRGFRDLAINNRGGGIFELGNMSPELQQASKSGTISKQQLDYLTSPFEKSIASGLNLQQMSPPSQSKSKFYLKQGNDNNSNTQILMIPTGTSAGNMIQKNATIEGQRFMYDANYNVFKTENEISSEVKRTLLRRLGIN